MVSRDWRERIKMSQCLMHIEFRFGMMKGSEDRQCWWLYNNVNVFHTLNCILKNIKIVNFMLCIFYHISIYLNLLLFTTFITIILIWNTVISHLHYDNSLLKHLPAFNLAPMSVRSLHTTAEWCFKPLGRCCNLPDQNSVRMNSNSKIELVIKDLGLCSCFHSSQNALFRAGPLTSFSFLLTHYTVMVAIPDHLI